MLCLRHYFADKGPNSQSYGFPSGHVWMWELDNKKGWVWKNWCLQTVVLEKTLESPLDCKEIQPVHPKGNQPWIFIGRTDAEAPNFGHLMWRQENLMWRKDPDAGKDWRQQKWVAEDEIVESITDSTDVNLCNSEWQELGMLQAMGLQRVRYDLASKQQ